ncbi:MAG: hypothetical protein FWF51_02505 [Chitinivibrionia bacterium]|nr:hypothetical protein [Chitinivibrionia bacterium]
MTDLRENIKEANGNAYKFRNGDVRLDEVVERNGGKFSVSNIDILLDASWRTTNGKRENV